MVITRLDDLLAEPLDPTAASILLGARAITLGLLGRPQETIAAALQSFSERVENPRSVPRIFASSRRWIGEVMIDDQPAAAAQALNDVVAFYGADDDYYLRLVAVQAIEGRIRALNRLGDIDGVGAAWKSAYAEYSAESDPDIRQCLAEAGRRAAHALSLAGRTKEALATADEVIHLSQEDDETDPRVP